MAQKQVQNHVKMGDNRTVINDNFTELYDKSDGLNAQVNVHTSDKDNPHAVTKSQVGLNNVDNTSDKDKPVSAATQAVLDTKANTTDLDTHTSNNTAHITSAERSKWNTVDTKYAKPTTGIPKTDLDLSVQGSLNKADSALQSETKLSKGTTIGTGNVVTDISVNDHQITLSKALNAAILDTNNKISMANLPDFILGQLTTGGTFVPSTGIATLTDSAKTKLGVTANTITLTNDTADKTGYTSSQSIYYLANMSGTFATLAFEVGDWLIGTASGWQKIDNTDAVTSVAGRIGAVILDKGDVGLGNVDNTADLDKPVSTATQTALNTKAPNNHASTATTYGVSTTANYGHSKLPSTTSTGAGEVMPWYGSLSSTDLNTLINPGIYKITVATTNSPQTTGVNAMSATLVVTPTSNTRAVQHFYGNDGNYYTRQYQNSAWNAWVKMATQIDVDTKANTADLTSHTSNETNPHSVTKSQVGLSNADNTSDLDKPVSAATQAVLNTKADSSNINGENLFYNPFFRAPSTVATRNVTDNEFVDGWYVGGGSSVQIVTFGEYIRLTANTGTNIYIYPKFLDSINLKKLVGQTLTLTLRAEMDVNTELSPELFGCTYTTVSGSPTWNWTSATTDVKTWTFRLGTVSDTARLRILSKSAVASRILIRVRQAKLEYGTISTPILPSLYTDAFRYPRKIWDGEDTIAVLNEDMIIGRVYAFKFTGFETQYGVYLVKFLGNVTNHNMFKQLTLGTSSVVCDLGFVSVAELRSVYAYRRQDYMPSSTGNTITGSNQPMTIEQIWDTGME